jgi:hypothetical protein
MSPARIAREMQWDYEMHQGFKEYSGGYLQRQFPRLDPAPRLTYQQWWRKMAEYDDIRRRIDVAPGTGTDIAYTVHFDFPLNEEELIAANQRNARIFERDRQRREIAGDPEIREEDVE